ncbi:hypothetical protein P7M47_10305 [Bisgaard Taxon 10/6]|uniref:hypothetical protein n=1 Tax=Exercitatus varius TaxID=67857 RepID=UPI00294B6E34|nr:hypothetical protein [Exercitatus varius]MDG2916359.1 hypothetical protein [Exercitatus varius]MDG2943278.1 hypothetical protein [Exercitatus varius]MDG2958406.1 hypothetical protein [Exercitatus varius]MDG2962121.1 hypothetical protein [Exercitatus varius]
MFKQFSLAALIAMTAACSSISDYVPFMGNSKPVIDLEQDQIDQKSYAVAYASTVQTYKGQINDSYDVNNFASGVNDWNRNRILVPVEQIRAKLSSGIDSNVHAYYSGVVFASDLQNNFSRLSKDCWSKIDRPSMTQGIYDAMLDLKKGKARNENDEYISKGSEQLLDVCK